MILVSKKGLYPHIFTQSTIVFPHKYNVPSIKPPTKHDKRPNEFNSMCWSNKLPWKDRRSVKIQHLPCQYLIGNEFPTCQINKWHPWNWHHCISQTEQNARVIIRSSHVHVHVSLSRRSKVDLFYEHFMRVLTIIIISNWKCKHRT